MLNHLPTFLLIKIRLHKMLIFNFLRLRLIGVVDMTLARAVL